MSENTATENTENTNTESTEGKKRERIPFDADKAVAKFSRDTVRLALDLVKRNAAEEQRATTTPELAEALFGHIKYNSAVGYLMSAQLSAQVEMVHGQTGGYVPAGFEIPKLAKGAGAVRRVEVSAKFTAAVESAIEQCLTIAKKGGRKGTPLDTVTMRLVENDVMNGDELASASAVTAALHGHLFNRFTTKAGIGIVELAPGEAATAPSTDA